MVPRVTKHEQTIFGHRGKLYRCDPVVSMSHRGIMLAMDEAQVRKQLLEHYGIRVDREMSRYVLRRLDEAGSALRELSVMGGDARTGVPVRLLIDPSAIHSPRAPEV